MPNPIYVRLDEPAFRTLCVGQVVELESVHGDQVRLVLADIGVVPMLRAVMLGTKEQAIAVGCPASERKS